MPGTRGCVSLARPTSAICRTCHAATSGRPAIIPQIVPGHHFSGGQCLRCHDPHSIVGRRPPRSPSVDDLPGCTSCHAHAAQERPEARDRRDPVCLPATPAADRSFMNDLPLLRTARRTPRPRRAQRDRRRQSRAGRCSASASSRCRASPVYDLLRLAASPRQPRAGERRADRGDLRSHDPPNGVVVNTNACIGYGAVRRGMQSREHVPDRPRSRTWSTTHRTVDGPSMSIRPNGGIDGFDAGRRRGRSRAPRSRDVRFVPRLCMQCEELAVHGRLSGRGDLSIA